MQRRVSSPDDVSPRASHRLPDPYYAGSHLAIYALGVVVIWRRISVCRRLAGTAEQKGMLFSVRIWVVIAVIGLISRVSEVYHSTDRHVIRLARDISLLLAVWAALRLVEHLMMSACGGESGDGRGINLKRVFEEPRTFDLVLWAHGVAAIPYLEEGELVTRETARSLSGAFQGRFLACAVWFQ
jgi:hypothetical protein